VLLVLATATLDLANGVPLHRTTLHFSTTNALLAMDSASVAVMFLANVVQTLQARQEYVSQALDQLSPFHADLVALAVWSATHKELDTVMLPATVRLDTSSSTIRSPAPVS
jgi:hypothetical protein